MAIIAALRSAGLDAYLPGGHEGLCTSPYCVVQQLSGMRLGGRGGCAHYRVHLFVPCTGGVGMDAFAARVLESLRELVGSGRISLEEPRGAVLTDDSRRALSSHIDYISYYTEN